MNKQNTLYKQTKYTLKKGNKEPGRSQTMTLKWINVRLCHIWSMTLQYKILQVQLRLGFTGKPQ